MTYGEPSFNYIWDKIKALLAKELGVTQEEASAALIAARQATSDSSYARTEADSAREYALSALQSSREAKEDAESAQASADAAQASATRAEAEATRAGTAADNAVTQAEQARQSAVQANASANGALSQLAVVEQVLDVLNWITDHGTYTLTTDTTVDPDKTYFVLDDGVYTPVAEPKDEDISTYYELEIDEALSDYVSSHLALTNDGLYVLKDNQSYKVLVSNTGVEIQDSRGVTVAKYGENIEFSEDVPQHIGGENAYILFNPLTETLTIGGNQVVFGSKPLSELLSDISTASSQASSASSAVTDMQQRMDSGEFDGEDATVVKIDSSHGNVFKNNAVSTVLTVSVYTGNLRITNQTDLVAKYGSTANIKWYWQRFGESEFHIIPSTDSKLSNDGFSLTLTPDQVDTKITFIAELNI